MSRAEEPKLGEALVLAEVVEALPWEVEEGMLSEMRSPMDGGR